MKYTIAELPEELDAALREKARTEGKTVEQIAVEALTAYTRTKTPQPQRDLSFFGDLSEEDARAIEDAHDFCDRLGSTTGMPK